LHGRNFPSLTRTALHRAQQKSPRQSEGF